MTIGYFKCTYCDKFFTCKDSFYINNCDILSGKACSNHPHSCICDKCAEIRGKELGYVTTVHNTVEIPLEQIIASEL